MLAMSSPLIAGPIAREPWLRVLLSVTLLATFARPASFSKAPPIRQPSWSRAIHMRSGALETSYRTALTHRLLITDAPLTWYLG
jgi:hypothetical protein